MSTPTKDGITIVLSGAETATAFEAWSAFLPSLGREWEVLTFDESLTPLGTGEAWRKAMDFGKYPLLLLTDSNYPYTPADLTKFLERIDTAGEMPDPATGEFVQRKPDLIAGCRTGVKVPLPLRILGGLYRGFCKIALGLPLPALPGWYGFREHARAWRLWMVYGVPLNDPHAGFKLVRRSFLERFPIQCDGDLAHVEIIAKATFLTAMMDELPLTPKPDAVRRVEYSKKERRALWNRPRFWHRREPSAVSGRPSVRIS